MSTELIRAVYVRPDGVYLNSKSNNDDRPFRDWKCDSLTDIYQNEGQRGLDREIVRMLCEYAQIQGHHASMERYRPCLLARSHFSIDYVKKLDAEYEKLPPEDKLTLFCSVEKQSLNAKAYNAFKREAENKYYTDLAGCAPLPIAKKPRQKSDLQR